MFGLIESAAESGDDLHYNVTCGLNTHSMPLVERCGDWAINDGSFDDPHMLEFDHRIEAHAADSKHGLSTVEDNVKATCVITVLKPEFGWIQMGNIWLYDPTHKETDLKSIWNNNLPECVQHDKEALKDCFCNPATNPATAYTGPEAGALLDKINALEWPSHITDFVSRFRPSGQYMIGPRFCSAYHIGDGYVGTAGHVLDKALIDNQLGELRVVFNWVGDVGCKKAFTKSEVFKIERVVLCDTHGPAPSPTNPTEISTWSRRWDSAIFKLVSSPNQFSNLKSAKHTARPPEFGNPVYNIGSPLGTQLKVSGSAHVLRHSLLGHDKNPFSHQVHGCGTFTTDLDQCEGNSGGPVFDANTGYVVGHTSSTQNAASESDVSALESWAGEHARDSSNYALIADINHLLEKQDPNNGLYRVHLKFLRTLSGKPRDSPLIQCATNVCPGDLGPNRVMQAPGKNQAVFSRHHFNTKDVHLRNITARVDRDAIFMTSLHILIRDSDHCILTVTFAGKAEAFEKPDANNALVVTNSTADWEMRKLDLCHNTTLSNLSGLEVWSVSFDLSGQRHEIPPAFLNAPRGLIEWTSVRLEQPLRNAPLKVGLNLSIRRPSFAFPVNKTWPSDRPDVTGHPADVDLEWPGETFEFATTAGETSGTSQTGGFSKPATERSNVTGGWIWEAPLDRVWTNPRQPSHGLRDSLMDDIDEVLA